MASRSSAADGSAHVHRLSRRAPSRNIEPGFAGERGPHSGNLRVVSRQRPAVGPIRHAHRSPGSYDASFQVWRRRAATDRRELCQLPWRAQHSASSDPNRLFIRKIWRKPAVSVTLAPERGSRSRPYTSRRTSRAGRGPLGQMVLFPAHSVVIGLMLLHNAGDWVRKVYRLRSERGREPGRGRPTLHPKSACCPLNEFSMPYWRCRSSLWSGPVLL